MSANRLRAAALVPPTVVFVAPVIVTPVTAPEMLVPMSRPSRFVPMKLPSTTLSVAPEPVICTPEPEAAAM